MILEYEDDFKNMKMILEYEDNSRINEEYLIIFDLCFDEFN